MRYSIRLFAPAIAAAAFLALNAPMARADETQNKSYTVSGRPTVHVETNDGHIHVATSTDTKTVEYKGKRIGFCCASCIADFKKDPEKYMKDLK